MSTKTSKKQQKTKVVLKNDTCTNNRKSDENTSNKENIDGNCREEKDGWILFGFGILVTAVYVSTVYPSVPGGDSGELITAAYELGVAHPPGYPLFTLLSWLSINILLVGSVAWRVNILNAVLSGAAVTLLSMAVLRLTRRLSAAILIAGLWGFCKLTWTWSTTAEVFGLNNLFVAVLVLIGIEFNEATEDQKAKVSVIGAFVCGFSLCNQHTIVIYVAALALWVLKELNISKDLTHLMKLTCAFLLGLSPYLYLPISSYLKRSRWTWGDQSSLFGFISHLLRQEYGTFDLGKDQSGQGIQHALWSYVCHITSDLSPLTVLLFFMGSMLLYHRRRSVLVIYWCMAMIYLIFFSWRANLDIKNPLLLGVVERFWMQSDMIVMVIAATAFSELIRIIENISRHVQRFHVDLVLAILLSSYQIHKNFQSCNQSKNSVIHEFGMEVLSSMPEGAIVLTKGDLPSNAIRYLYLCENVRPDIHVFDQEVLTYEWSLPMLRWSVPGIKFPGDLLHLRTLKQTDGRQSFNFKSFLDANFERAQIFGCIGVQDHEMSWKSSYDLLPFGVCQQFVKKGTVLNVPSYTAKTKLMAENWTYPSNSFDDTSWEKVANEEMWHAKMSSAFYLYGLAAQTSGNDNKEVILHSYQIYNHVINSNKNFPSHWHKNYALVCEKMLHLSHDIDKMDLLRASIHHFQVFIEMEPSDLDVEAIKTVIKELKHHLHLISTHKP